SARYSDSSHRLLMAFLRQNHFDRELGELVDAINPSRYARAPEASTLTPQSLDEVNRFVSHSERDGKGVPVLLRQYLKLNARLLGFNVDPAFGESLDALMLVDLTTVDSTILARYMGQDGASHFLSYHERKRAIRAA